MKSIILIVLIVLVVRHFNEPEDKYGVGYDDGYATGYNTTCEIKATLIEGDWENESYSNGYNAGYRDGSIACNQRNYE
jgi:hypothetical protein